MKYSKVAIEAIGYELAPCVVTTDELEERIAPVYKKLGIQPGQLEAWTGIYERRWWPEQHRLSDSAISAAQKALAQSDVQASDLGALIYAGVCRESYEPATACRVAAALGVDSEAAVHDISNACLGVLNGILDIANRIELGQVEAGMVCSCESAREINEIIIEQMHADPSMEFFTRSLATLTGGSGAVAVIVKSKEFMTDSAAPAHGLIGAVSCTEPQHNGLCKWGMSNEPQLHEYMFTDSVAVLNHGVALGSRTWNALLRELDWSANQVDKAICHQVGSAHIKTIMQTIGLDPAHQYSTYPYLGNIGTVSLPITAAIAQERSFLQPNDQVVFMGIGSGLNCMMLGVDW